MPQRFHVIRCYKCETFQVDIVKKSNKWQCKLCGEKQSVKQVYTIGSPKDCRSRVQQLNELRMVDDELKLESLYEKLEKQSYSNSNVGLTKSKSSKWDEFLLVKENESEKDSCLLHAHPTNSGMMEIPKVINNEVNIYEQNHKRLKFDSELNQKTDSYSYTTQKFHDEKGERNKENNTHRNIGVPQHESKWNEFVTEDDEELTDDKIILSQTSKETAENKLKSNK